MQPWLFTLLKNSRVGWFQRTKCLLLPVALVLSFCSFSIMVALRTTQPQRTLQTLIKVEKDRSQPQGEPSSVTDSIIKSNFRMRIKAIWLWPWRKMKSCLEKQGWEWNLESDLSKVLLNEVKSGSFVPADTILRMPDNLYEVLIGTKPKSTAESFKYGYAEKSFSVKPELKNLLRSKIESNLRECFEKLKGTRVIDLYCEADRTESFNIILWL